MDNFSIELGKKDAEHFIAGEQIEYKPFVAMSDLYMVRKTVALDYQSFQDTINEIDPDLWQKIDDAATRHADDHNTRFDYNEYALGFTEGVSNVWDKIRDDILS